MRRRPLASVILLATLSIGTFSQSLSTALETTPSPSPSSGSLSPGQSPSITSAESSRLQTTLARSTTSSTATGHNALGPTKDNSTDGNNPPPPPTGLLNYYFAFLAVLVVIILVGGWWVHRRQKMLKALRANSRQTALSRDLDYWAGGRRWVGGPFRGGLGRRHDRERSREEGLNELGEAPPPYKARESVTAQQEEERRIEPPSEPAVPLRTLDPDRRVAAKPPEYLETVTEMPPQDAASPNSPRGRISFARTTPSEHIRFGST